MNTIAITPKSEDKYVVKVFNWPEVHLSEMTCYKIHTLVVLDDICTYFKNNSFHTIMMANKGHKSKKISFKLLKNTLN